MEDELDIMVPPGTIITSPNNDGVPSSLSINMHDISASTAQASKEQAIGALLEICAENKVEINDTLRRAILGEELYNEAKTKNKKAIRRQTYGKRESVLGALVRTNEAETKANDEAAAAGRVGSQGDISQEMHTKLKSMKMLTSSFEVRITNGSYTVTMDKNSGGNKKKGQHIPTVTTPIFKGFQAIKRMVTGCHRQQTETKTIMDGINLVLEEGKMYLILGAPGSGKSTLLKMIANIITKDSKHVLGGSVQVNGFDSNDNEIVWSVSYMCSPV